MSKPVNKFRLKGVEIVQWDNDGKPSFTVSKSYKTQAGEWKNTTSLYLEDLANLSAVATLALVANYSNKLSAAQLEPSQHEQEKANAYQRTIPVVTLSGFTAKDEKDSLQDEIPF